ncbi:type II toxin-antitoxin system VapC family toxin [Desulfococcaceae bacterium HSG8]|nr:type II toxin-antitoxin system VapC family toxin [Desulfococcaceae bacterium HSG8]
MMIIFMDTSAWVKYFIEEDGTRELQNFIQDKSASDMNVIAASAVTYAEMYATFRRALRGNRITESEYDEIVSNFEEQWDNIDIPEPSDRLIKRSGLLAGHYALKGCDAFQLASALEIRAAMFICSDNDLKDAANDSGFIVWNPADGEFGC